MEMDVLPVSSAQFVLLWRDRAGVGGRSGDDLVVFFDGDMGTDGDSFGGFKGKGLVMGAVAPFQLAGWGIFPLFLEAFFANAVK
ncbi:MAG: hypothetical protein HW380_1010 [Magnetococcales bacterium]|nr:hypothetical protein [Magnetococcales bacterium]